MVFLILLLVVGLERITEIDLSQNQLNEFPIIRPENTLKVFVRVHIHVHVHVHVHVCVSHDINFIFIVVLWALPNTFYMEFVKNLVTAPQKYLTYS